MFGTVQISLEFEVMSRRGYTPLCNNVGFVIVLYMVGRALTQKSQLGVAIGGGKNPVPKLEPGFSRLIYIYF